MSTETLPNLPSPVPQVAQQTGFPTARTTKTPDFTTPPLVGSPIPTPCHRPIPTPPPHTPPTTNDLAVSNPQPDDTDTNDKNNNNNNDNDQPPTPSDRTKFISDGVTLKGLIFNLIGRGGSPQRATPTPSTPSSPSAQADQDQQQQKRRLEEEQQQQKRLLLERQLRDAHNSLSQMTTKTSHLQASLSKAISRAETSEALASELQKSSSRLQADSIEQKEAMKTLDFKQESLRKILVDAKTKHDGSVMHLESVKARNLSLSAESLKLSTKNRKLDLDHSFEKEKNEALTTNNQRLQKTCKELRGDLAKAECDVKKAGVSIASQEKKIRQMTASLSSSSRLVKSLRGAVSAKETEEAGEKDAIFVLSTRNAELAHKLEKINGDEHKEIRRLNEVVASLEVEKRKLELAGNSNDAFEFSAEEEKGFKRAFDVLESGEIEKDVGAEKVDDDDTSKGGDNNTNVSATTAPPAPPPTPPSKKLKASACGLCNKPKNGLMISCKPDKNKKCPHHIQAHIACTAKSSKTRFICKDCEQECGGK